MKLIKEMILEESSKHTHRHTHTHTELRFHLMQDFKSLLKYCTAAS